MERHVQRLIASCGLSNFSYRAWAGAEIELREAPAAPAAATPSLLRVVTEPSPIIADAINAVKTEVGAAAGAPVAARSRGLLANLSRFIDDPKRPVASHAATVAPQIKRSRGPLVLPPADGFEAPIHVGYRQPPKKTVNPQHSATGTPRSVPGAVTSGGGKALPARRFALLDELLPAPLRRPDRRAPESTSSPNI